MIKLRDASHDVPGGWWYIQPETQFRVVGNTFVELLNKIKEHRVGNELPIGTNFNAEIQAAICERLGDDTKEWCTPYDPEDQRLAPPRRMSWQDAMRFLATVKAIVMTGNAFTDQAEAERRAAICANCPKNVAIDTCPVCRGLKAMVTGVIGQRRTAVDNRLRGCEVCGCELKAAVHVDLAAQQAAMSDELNEQFPAHCWKKK